MGSTPRTLLAATLATCLVTTGCSSGPAAGHAGADVASDEPGASDGGAQDGAVLLDASETQDASMLQDAAELNDAAVPQDGGPIRPRSAGLPFLWGVGESLVGNSLSHSHKWDIDAQVDEMLALSPQAARMWMTFVFDNSGVEAGANVSAYHTAIARLQAGGVTVVGMYSDFPKWMTTLDDQAVPAIDYAPSSACLQFLNNWETTWRRLAQDFPEIQTWEVGNEFNLDGMLHSGPCFDGGCPSFDPNGGVDNKAAVTTLLMLYASRGVHAAQPKAFIFMPAVSAVMFEGPDGGSSFDLGMPDRFLDLLYADIDATIAANKKLGIDLTKRDFFMGACWHPYLLDAKAFHHSPQVLKPVQPTHANWVDPNIRLHHVLTQHCDGDTCDGGVPGNIPVYFSEFGASDPDTGSDTRANWMLAAATLAAEIPAPRRPARVRKRLRQGHHGWAAARWRAG